MLEKEIELLDKVYEMYNVDAEENIDVQILEYIGKRIIANKEEINKFLEYSKEDISYEQILETFEKASNEKSLYKKEKKMQMLENGFVYGTYTTSVGNIVVECSNPLKVLKYFVLAIKTRNTVTISDIDYDELNIKSFLLTIFSESLEKFNINKNLIMILPYEECYYDKFDKIIIDTDEEYKIINKEKEDKLYIYEENRNFTNYIQKEEIYLKAYDKNYEILTGDFYEVIKKINKKEVQGAVIYTTSQTLAYKFLNLVHSKNVFVNSSFSELDLKIKDLENPFYFSKKIMYQLYENKK
jgi:hypothetical protein